MLPAIAIAAAALAAFALYETQSAKAAPGTPSPGQQDLLNLGKNSPSTYQAVVALLNGGNPATMIQYAAQLYSQYPALAKQLGDMAKSATTDVTGKSGTTWSLWSQPQPQAKDVTLVQVMLGAGPVIRYMQTGTGTTAPRQFADSTPGVDSATVAKARQDFGV